MLTKKWRRTPPSPTPEYEFMGPPGALAMLVLMPMLTYGLYFNCRPGFGCVPFEWDRSDGLWPPADSFNPLQIPSSLWGFFLSTWDLDAFLVYSTFITYLIICYFVIPGPIIDGTVVAGVGGTPLTKDRTKYRLKYRLNAFRTLMVTLTIVGVTLAIKGTQPFLFLYDHFLGILTASMVWTFTLSAFLYLWSFLPDSSGRSKILAKPGNTGNHLYDFAMGRELNPRFNASPDSIFDLKYFAELRPGLIGWVLVNISMACQQYQILDNGRVTNSMMLVLAFETFYVLDALWNEALILTTMDITTEGFGFMLADAQCSWVPLNYSLQARFLATFPLEMELWHVLLVIATQTVGYYIFRSANTQKDTFRRFGVDDPRNKGLKYLETEAGPKLLISGWWGTARHINYMGDWMMALAWSLPCGFNTPIPYFYPIYFAILLIHREIRDEHNCHKKYGKDWERYCELVPWRIIPYVY